MAKNKTQVTAENVENFIHSFANTAQKKQDSFELMELMQSLTGYEPKMWGSSIIGFGEYQYKYESGHQGNAALIGFSPRKTAISLYVFTGLEEHEYLLENLGKFKKGKACIYVNKLSDINQDALKKLITETIHYLQTKYNNYENI